MAWRPDRSAAAVAVALALGTATAGVAGAAMTGRATAVQTVATASLAAPTNVAAAAGPCLVAVSASITVSWTPTASEWADGYEVLQALVDGGPYTPVATVAGRASSSVTVTGLAFVTPYHFVVRATKGSWRSPLTPQVTFTTPSALCG